MPYFSQTHRTTIGADEAAVHALINDFHEWQRWSPWEELDPDLERTFNGPEAGVGARYAWAGNKKVGTGSMEITLSSPDRIDIDLEFLAPMKAHNKITFALTPVDDGTEVAWTMSGDRNLLMTVMGKVYFDKAIGRDFERGLAKLKAAAEGG